MCLLETQTNAGLWFENQKILGQKLKSENETETEKRSLFLTHRNCMKGRRLPKLSQPPENKKRTLRRRRKRLELG